MTLRGKEASSLCLAVRANVARRVALDYWERREDGRYKTRTGVKVAYTRVLCGTAHVDRPIAWFGQECTIAVVHLHRCTANKQK